WRLADFAGSKVIVYFYPAALTPGCTLEAVDFTTRRGAFASAGYAVVGISPDAPEKLARFIASKSLTVALLSDPDRTVIDAYGAWGTKVLYGKPMQGVIRSTFIVDVDDAGKGTIVKAMYNVKATGHVDRLARDLGID
ncbi:MAG: peroxiredoxin, partial [Propionibacteriaceae bacterium]|nr:peroxiredoxin [Propionibacteriaceae bacterium]